MPGTEAGANAETFQSQRYYFLLQKRYAVLLLFPRSFHAQEQLCNAFIGKAYS